MILSLYVHTQHTLPLVEAQIPICLRCLNFAFLTLFSNMGSKMHALQMCHVYFILREV